MNVSTRALLVAAALFAVSLATISCTKPAASDAARAAEGPVNRFALTGQVIQLDEAHQLAVIKHQNIEGFMEAMTMEFPVKDKAEFAKLKVGMPIQATVFQEPKNFDFWVGEIKPQAASPAGVKSQTNQ